MKKLFKISLFSFFALLAVACTDGNDDANQDALSGSQNLGGLLTEITPSVTYATGSLSTDMSNSSFDVFQGNEKIEKVEVYKQYYGIVAGAVVMSNKVLFKTLVPTLAQHSVLSYSYNYADLIDGLTYNGSPLPTSDATLEIGSYWKMTYVSYLSNGEVHENAKFTKVNVACGSFLAGNYIINYTSGPKLHVVTDLGGGTYKMSSMFGWPTSGYVVKFTDICGNLTLIDEWQFSNHISGVGVVQPNGDLNWTGVTVENVYSNRSYNMIKQ